MTQAGAKKAVGGAPQAAEGADATVSKLQAHFQTLDGSSLARVARAVELARATDQGDPTDTQILECLRPRLRDLRPGRVPTFQRALCVCLEPYLRDLDMQEEKRRGVIARRTLSVWWRLIGRSEHRARLEALQASYCTALAAGDEAAVQEAVDEGCMVAAAATAGLLEEADHSIVRKGELTAQLRGEHGLADVREIALLMELQPLLAPVFTSVRANSPVLPDGRVADFAPPAVFAAKSAYLNMHGAKPAVVEYFFLGLMSVLAQPWQTLRLVRVLSADMSKAGSADDLRFVPGRLFSELTRTLSEIGRQVNAGGGTMSRRVWLMTCARLLTDAGTMIQGLGEEVQAEPNADWESMLTDARQKIAAAADQFATVAVRDAVRVLPVKMARDKGSEARTEPDMARAPTDEEIAVAQAAATLFTACRRLFEKEGLDKSLRAKEADLVQKFENGVHLRVEVLRARGKQPPVLAQLQGVETVLRTMVQTDAVRDLVGKVERFVERYK